MLFRSEVFLISGVSGQGVPEVLAALWREVAAAREQRKETAA